jgi:hypothetical protein
VRHKGQPTGSYREINLLRAKGWPVRARRMVEMLKNGQPCGGKNGRLLVSGQMSATRFEGSSAMVVECGQILFRMRRFCLSKNISRFFKKNRNSPLLKLPITVR